MRVQVFDGALCFHGPLCLLPTVQLNKTDGHSKAHDLVLADCNCHLCQIGCAIARRRTIHNDSDTRRTLESMAGGVAQRYVQQCAMRCSNIKTPPAGVRFRPSRACVTRQLDYHKEDVKSRSPSPCVLHSVSCFAGRDDGSQLCLD